MLLFFPLFCFLFSKVGSFDDDNHSTLQDRFVQGKSKASWTSCTGETKTCCKEEKPGGHAGETTLISCVVLDSTNCM